MYGRLAVVARVLDQDVLGHGPLQRLLEQPEGTLHALGRVPVCSHSGHEIVDVRYSQLAQLDVADVFANELRLVAVAPKRRRLDDGGALLVLEEIVQELPDRHVRARCRAFKLKLHYELVALPLGLPLRLRLDGVVARHAVAGQRVLVGEDHLPLVRSPAPSQPSARVLH